MGVNLQSDPYPPAWQGGAGPAIHFAPAAWPDNPKGAGWSDSAPPNWIAYTSQAASLKDPKNLDPSNGGTSPQNYVNVSSGCADITKPSVYYSFDPVAQVLFFRWRVAQIAHTYATGPSAGSFASSDPWRSALWTVLMDLNGDGYRDFAVHLDGSSGRPATPIDLLDAIYATSPGQSIDYLNDPQVHLLAHNPTAFTDGTLILNFQNALTPVTAWPLGGNETVWDYGTTRAVRFDTGGCTEFFVDYQIPLAMLDASAVGGPQVTATTPMALAFATANSLNNPLQKDYVLSGDFLATPTGPIPGGDVISMEGGTRQAPVILSVTATGCGPVQLSAQVADALIVVNGSVQSSVTSAEFFSYPDLDGNGQPDDAQTWTLAATGSASPEPLGRWTATWNNTSLPRGTYLIGVRATDQQGNITWSFLEEADLPTGTEHHANLSPEPGLLWVSSQNHCGLPPPGLAKSVHPTTVAAGDPVTFTLTLQNTSLTPLTVTSLTDALPPGFAYTSTDTGNSTLPVPATSPAPGATDSLLWTFDPAAEVPAGQSRTLVFSATAAPLPGTYNNLASADTSAGPLVSNPASVGVGAPRLTLAKSSSHLSAAPGDSLTFTLTYADNSPVDVSDVTLTDPLPSGLEFVSATDGGTFDPDTGILTWNLGALGSGEGPLSVSFEARIVDPYPDAAPVPLLNSATLDSAQTEPVSARASVFVTAPRPAMRLQKTANLALVAPGGDVVFTLTYANVGNAAATGVVISDPVPAGFTYRSASPAPASAPSVGGTGTVTWNIGSVAAGGGGTVSLTLRADSPYTAANPQANVASITRTGVTGAEDTDQCSVGITGGTCATQTFYFKNLSAAALPAAQGLPTTTQRYYANSTAPTSGTATSVSVATTTSELEVARFFQDPPQAVASGFTGTINTTLYINKGSGNPVTFRLYLYSYDSVTGEVYSMGSSAANTDNGGANNVATLFTITPTAPLNEGDRLLWRLTAQRTSGQATPGLAAGLSFDGTASQSQSTFCPLAIKLDFNKSVEPLVSNPGGTLQYRLSFANPSATAVTEATLVDTLPAGVSFVSATLNGSAITPTISNGQQLTFLVNSGDTATPGRISGGQSGVLLLNVTVQQPLPEGVHTLLNTASLASTQTLPLTDTATTTVLRPQVLVSKSVSDALLVPGDTATFSLVAQNTGPVAASGVILSDVLPITPYFDLVPGSVALNGAPLSPDPVAAGTLTVSVGTLAAGATATVTFQMQAASSGVPDGFTDLDNVARVTDAQTSGQRESDPVTVTFSTSPNLRLLKTVAPEEHVQPGDLLTYTLQVENIGSGTATSVQVLDPIPGFTTYVADSAQLVAPTDPAPTGFAAVFEPAWNRVRFTLGDLSGGASVTVRFAVRLAATFPAGDTDIVNTAQATAANTSSRTDSTSTPVQARPQLTFAKSGPSAVAWPVALVTENVFDQTVLPVSSTTLIELQQYLRINGQVRQVLGLGDQAVTLDSPVSASANDPVTGSLRYALLYANQGTAPATEVTLQDMLPANTTFVAASGNGVHDSVQGTVTWDLADLDPGAAGSVTVFVLPDAPGTFLNTATLTSALTEPQSDSVTTEVGGLNVTKATTTPELQQTSTGTRATYIVQVHNSLTSPATGIRITDSLESGLTYAATVSIENPGGSQSDPALSPVPGDTEPLWGTFTIAGGATLTLTFEVAFAPNVGSALYQNGIEVTSNNASVIPFDPLVTPDEDVLLNPPPPTAAVLAYFRAEDQTSGPVALAWGTLVETDTLGFHLERSSDGVVWQRLTTHLIPATGWGPQPQNYTFLDQPPALGRPVHYRLFRVDLAGRTRFLASTATAAAPAPARIHVTDTAVILEFVGEPHASGIAEAAEHILGPWTSLSPVAFGPSGTATVRFDRTSDTPTRFFRLR